MFSALNYDVIMYVIENGVMMYRNACFVTCGLTL